MRSEERTTAPLPRGLGEIDVDRRVSAGGEVTAGRTSSFTSFADSDVTDLIAEYPLAWLCPRGPAPLASSLLPLLAETDAGGKLTTLVGHMARRNPLFALLQATPDVLILFTGPQAYVSPGLVSDPAWAPTWNYAQLRIEARIVFDPEGGDAALAMLVAAMDREERTGWTRDRMGARYRPMEQAIIAFRAQVVGVAGTFKLGQDEPPARLREILAGHADPALLRWMRRFNAARV